jgi:NADPH2:quinone reductase
MRRLARLVEQGSLRPLVDPRRFDVSTVGGAHEYLESGAATGKVVLQNDL